MRGPEIQRVLSLRLIIHLTLHPDNSVLDFQQYEHVYVVYSFSYVLLFFTGLVNLGVFAGIVGFFTITGSQVDPWNTFFYLLLITLLVTLYDRYRPRVRGALLEGRGDKPPPEFPGPATIGGVSGRAETEDQPSQGLSRPRRRVGSRRSCLPAPDAPCAVSTRPRRPGRIPQHGRRAHRRGPLLRSPLRAHPDSGPGGGGHLPARR